jgi:hypothetical protein
MSNKPKKEESTIPFPDSVKPQFMHTVGGGTYSETGRIHMFRTFIEEEPPATPPNVGLVISPELQHYLDIEAKNPTKKSY